MTAAECRRCGRPTDGTVCHQDALSLAEDLREASGHAEDAETVIARQTRYGGGLRAGSGDGMTPNYAASAVYARFRNTISGWERDLVETGRASPRTPWQPYLGPLCAPARPGDEPRDGNRCEHDSCAQVRQPRPPELAHATLWLAEQVGQLRKHPAAGEAFDELGKVCAELAWIVDRPADRDLVGVCDCGKVLYAARERVYVTCPVVTCKLEWHIERSREILRRHLGDKLVTLPEAVRLAAYLDPDRTQDGIRKLLAARIDQLAPHGHLGEDEEPTYVFGDVVTLLASVPKRRRERATAVAEAAK